MNCPMTTGHNFEGYHITQYCGIITAEAHMVTSTKDNSQKWEAIRQTVYEELISRLPNGANAILGIQVAHNHFQGAGMASQFYFFATGTAVTIEPF